MPNRPALLVVTDDRAACASLEQVARHAGYRVEAHPSRHLASPPVELLHADVALIDLETTPLTTCDVLSAAYQVRPDCQVILIGSASASAAIEAVKHGALDYLTKPLAVDRLKHALTRAHDDIRRRSALLIAEQDMARRLELCGMVGRSAVMQQLFDMIRRLAPHVRAALVTGEPGTGKSLVARALHELATAGTRRCRFVGFDGAMADSGDTLFLDDVDALSGEGQGLVLRALESGQGPRVIAVTSRDLESRVEAGEFSAGLRDSLGAVHLEIPPLRERSEDIPYLVAVMMADCSRRFGKRLNRVNPAAERLLRRYSWPGHVGELRSVVERLCVRATTSSLTERDVARALPALHPSAPVDVRVSAEPSALEAREVQSALLATRGNKAAAARMLGVSRRMVYRRLSGL
jgi:DNA-binding NtrC family response regulator